MPRRPRIACLCGHVNLLTSSLVLCLLTSMYSQSSHHGGPTTDKRMQTCLEGSAVPPHGLVNTTYI
jgi:hypothetical protein